VLDSRASVFLERKERRGEDQEDVSLLQMKCRDLVVIQVDMSRELLQYMALAATGTI
jgi:hypothetical protein